MNVTMQTRTSQNPPQVYVKADGQTYRDYRQIDDLIDTLRRARNWLKAAAVTGK